MACFTLELLEANSDDEAKALAAHYGKNVERPVAR
jgi:hypothetical protein